MEFETLHSSRPDVIRKAISEMTKGNARDMEKIYMDRISVPLLINTLNSGRFSQASEQIRYLFVNATGYSNGCKDAYDKISWYSPKYHIEKLYMMRMFKLINGLQLSKIQSMANLKWYSKVVESPMKDTVIKDYSEWDVCMPHNSDSTLSDQSVFNGFYICRSFTVNQHQKVKSESEVILKQIEGREEFLKNHGKGLDSFSNFDLSRLSVDYLKKNAYVEENTYKNSNPSVASIICTAVFSALEVADCKKVDTSNCETIGDLIEILYPYQPVMVNSHISDVMNVRGSVTYENSTGLITSRKKKETFKSKDGKTVTKTIKKNQNGKCWSNVLMELTEFDKNTARRSLTPEERVSTNNLPLEKTSRQLEKTDTLNMFKHADLIWPLVTWNLNQSSQIVAKMVHKDQIGVRDSSSKCTWEAFGLCYRTG